MPSALNDGGLSTVNSILKSWSSIAVLGLCSQQMPLIFFWLQSPGASGLRFTPAVRDSSASLAERAPGQRHGTQHPGPVPGAEGRNRSSLRRLHPLQKCQLTAVLDGDEQLGTGGYCPEKGCSWPCKWPPCGGAPGREHGPTQVQTTVLTGSAGETDLGGRRPRQAPAPGLAS